MQIKLCLLILLSLCYCASAIKHQEQKKRPSEVRFTLSHREYDWREYGRDSVKISHPLQYLIDVYRVTYVLNEQELMLYKTAYRSGAEPVRIANNALSAQQARTFRQVIRHANPDSMALRSNNVAADDGFQAVVTVTKAGKGTDLFWNNNYVPELVALLSIVNATALEPFRIYPVSEEAAFIRQLKATSEYKK